MILNISFATSIIIHVKNSDGSDVNGIAGNQNGYNGLMWKVYYIYGNKGYMFSSYYLWGGAYYENATLKIDIPFYIPVSCSDSLTTGFFIEPYDSAQLYIYMVDAFDGKEGEWDTLWIPCDTIMNLEIQNKDYEKTTILHN